MIGAFLSLTCSSTLTAAALSLPQAAYFALITYVLCFISAICRTLETIDWFTDRVPGDVWAVPTATTLAITPAVRARCTAHAVHLFQRV